MLWNSRAFPGFPPCSVSNSLPTTTSAHTTPARRPSPPNPAERRPASPAWPPRWRSRTFNRPHVISGRTIIWRHLLRWRTTKLVRWQLIIMKIPIHMFSSTLCTGLLWSWNSNVQQWRQARCAFTMQWWRRSQSLHFGTWRSKMFSSRTWWSVTFHFRVGATFVRVHVGTWMSLQWRKLSFIFTCWSKWRVFLMITEIATRWLVTTSVKIRSFLPLAVWMWMPFIWNTAASMFFVSTQPQMTTR